MTAIRNNRLAVAVIRMARRLRLVESEAARRHAIAEAAREAIRKPMTSEERRQHGEAVAAVRRADEAKRQ